MRSEAGYTTLRNLSADVPMETAWASESYSLAILRLAHPLTNQMAADVSKKIKAITPQTNAVS